MPAKKVKETPVSTNMPKTTLNDDTAFSCNKESLSICHRTDNIWSLVFSITATQNGRWMISGCFTDFVNDVKNFPTVQNAFIQFFEEKATTFNHFIDIYSEMEAEYSLTNADNHHLIVDYVAVFKPLHKTIFKLINNAEDLVTFLTGNLNPSAKNKRAIIDALVDTDPTMLSEAIHDVSRLAHLTEYALPLSNTVFENLLYTASVSLQTWIKQSEKTVVFDGMMTILNTPIITEHQRHQLWDTVRYQTDNWIENIGQLTKLLQGNFLDEIRCIDLFSPYLACNVLEWIDDGKPEPVFLLLSALKKKMRSGTDECWINTLWWHFIAAFARKPSIKKLDGLFKLQSHLGTDLNLFKTELLAGTLLEGNPAAKGALLIVIMSCKKLSLDERLKFYRNAKKRIKESVQKTDHSFPQTVGAAITKTIERAKDFIPFYSPNPLVTDPASFAELELKIKKEFGTLITDNDLLIELLKIIDEPAERLFIIQSARTNQDVLNGWDNFRYILKSKVLTDSEIQEIWNDIKKMILQAITENKAVAFAILRAPEFTPTQHLEIFNYVIDDARINEIITSLESFIFIYQCVNLTPKERNLLFGKCQHRFDSWIKNIDLGVAVAYLDSSACKPPQLKEIWEKLIKFFIKKLLTNHHITDLLIFLDSATLPDTQREEILSNKAIIQACITSGVNLTDLLKRHDVPPTLQGIILNNLSEEKLFSFFNNISDFNRLIMCDNVDVDCDPILRRLSKQKRGITTSCSEEYASSSNENNIPNLRTSDKFIEYFRHLRAIYRINLLNHNPEHDSGCFFWSNDVAQSLREKITAIDQILNRILGITTSTAATHQSAIEKKKTMGRIGKAFNQWKKQNDSFEEDENNENDNNGIVSPRS